MSNFTANEKFSMYWDSEQNILDDGLASEYEYGREGSLRGLVSTESSSSQANQSFNLNGFLQRILRDIEEDKPEVPIQLENSYSLDNITEKDIDNIYNQWSVIRSRIYIFYMMFLKKLGEVSPTTMTKIKMEEGTLVGENIVFKTDSLQEARRFIKHLDKILMNLDKPEEINHQLSQIVGPYGYLQVELTKEDVESLVKATVGAIEGHLSRKLSKETLESFSKVLFLIYSLMQDLSKWNDRSDIYINEN